MNVDPSMQNQPRHVQFVNDSGRPSDESGGFRDSPPPPTPPVSTHPLFQTSPSKPQNADNR